VFTLLCISLAQAEKKEAHMAVKLQHNRWSVSDADFAVRIMVPDLKGFFGNVLLVSAYTRTPDKPTSPASRTPSPSRSSNTAPEIVGDVYDQVINAHASSLVAFDLPDGFNGSLQRWVAIAGLSKEISSPGSCRFRILGGDNLLWESGVIAQDKKTGLSVIEQFDVNLKDVKVITLEVDSLGANLSDWSVWVDPVLLWQGSTLAN